MPDSITPPFSAAIARFTSPTDPSPDIVDANEASELVTQAAEANDESSKLCGLIKGTKGSTGLQEAYTPESKKFSPLAGAIVDQFVHTGRPLDPEFKTQVESFTTDTDGVVNRKEAIELAGTALRLNQTSGNCFKHIFKIKSDRGTKELTRLRKNTDSLLSPDAKKVLDSFIKTGSTDKVISEWKASKKTWHCHWFPMKETKASGRDRTNNLFAVGGVLHKYDLVFGTSSRDHELKHNFRAYGSEEEDASWAGHCNNASEIACMVERPKSEVTYKGVTFSPHEIAGLLVKVSGSLRGDTDIVGDRFYSEKDVAGEPNPHMFLEQVLKAWGTDAEDPRPFVLDIDRTAQVWNYPYDQGRVIESEKAPKGFDASVLPEEGDTLFYRAELKGTTFGKQARNYAFWIQYGEDGSVIKSDWIKGDDPKISPDFAWRPHPVGDLSDKASWVTRPERQNNPEVRAEDVFEIYSRSLKNPPENPLAVLASASPVWG